jgi:hypothetical protein
MEITAHFDSYHVPPDSHRKILCGFLMRHYSDTCFLGDAWFESWVGRYQLSLLRYYAVFLGPSRQTPG